jgi:SpoVT / AbrB like domain.
MQTKIRQIGNSAGILIPARMLSELDLRVGAKVELSKDADRLVVRHLRTDRISVLQAMEEVLEEDREILDELAQR